MSRNLSSECLEFPQLCTTDGNPLCGPDSICQNILVNVDEHICRSIVLRCPTGTELVCGGTCGFESCTGNCCNCVLPGTKGTLSNGEACVSYLQCKSNLCQNGTCTACASDDQCPTNRCTAGTCMVLSLGQFCQSDTECFSNVCTNGLCVACTSDSQCSSGEQCRQGECSLLENGESCTASSQCLSNRCTGGICRSMQAENEESCSVGEECRSGLCRGDVCVPCNVHGDCRSGNVCYARRCIATPVIGNGILEPGEVCDDGNLVDGDGCSSRARLENGQACRGDRECQSNRCQNGICMACTGDSPYAIRKCLDGTCEDLCGNGRPDSGEECDRGGKNSDSLPDRCRTDCRNPRCGDAIVDRDEQCDDGNGVSGDGCDRLCRIEVRTVTIDLPVTPLTAQTVGDIAKSRAPAGQTGPGAIAVMAAGAAAGWAWMRRRRGK